MVAISLNERADLALWRQVERTCIVPGKSWEAEERPYLPGIVNLPGLLPDEASIRPPRG